MRKKSEKVKSKNNKDESSSFSIDAIGMIDKSIQEISDDDSSTIITRKDGVVFLYKNNIFRNRPNCVEQALCFEKLEVEEANYAIIEIKNDIDYVINNLLSVVDSEINKDSHANKQTEIYDNWMALAALLFNNNKNMTSINSEDHVFLNLCQKIADSCELKLQSLRKSQTGYEIICSEISNNQNFVEITCALEKILNADEAKDLFNYFRQIKNRVSSDCQGRFLNAFKTQPLSLQPGHMRIISKSFIKYYTAAKYNKIENVLFENINESNEISYRLVIIYNGISIKCTNSESSIIIPRIKICYVIPINGTNNTKN